MTITYKAKCIDSYFYILLNSPGFNWMSLSKLLAMKIHVPILRACPEWSLRPEFSNTTGFSAGQEKSLNYEQGCLYLDSNPWNSTLKTGA